MKLLHPTDFSGTAEKARVLALDLRERLSSSLDVMFVQEHFETKDNPYVSTTDDRIITELIERQREAREAQTKRYRACLEALTPQRGQAHLLWGEPVQEVLRLAQFYDLIVMGAHGAHGANRLDSAFLGGVAGRVVRRSPIPVLTVRDEAEVTRIKRILVATDFGEAAKHAWAWSQGLADRGVKLVAAHVIDEAHLQHNADYTQVVAEALQNLDREHCAERHIIRSGKPVDDLPKIAQEVGADVIVLGLRRHATIAGLLMGSRADALVRSSPVPILSVPLV